MHRRLSSLVLAIGVGCASRPTPAPVPLPDIIREFPSPGTAPSAPPSPPPDRETTRRRRVRDPLPVEAHGFGSGTQGGAGGRHILVTDGTEAGLRSAIEDANRGGRAIIEFSSPAYIRVLRPLPRLIGPWVTINGNGTTIDGSALINGAALLDIRTHDVIVRNLRLRNGYDNIRIQGPQASAILVSHVSSTGAEDDGISISGGAHDVTVQWSFLAGNTRSIFCKYLGTTRVSIHHTWIQKGWIRSPLFQGAMLADLRNVIVEDWGEWGARFQDGATGNVVGSLFTLSPAAREVGGKADSALRLPDSGAVHFAGNLLQGVSGDAATSAEPIRVAPVPTQTVAEMEPLVRGQAGCQPRDAVDNAYIQMKPGWTIGRRAPLRVATAR